MTILLLTALADRAPLASWAGSPHRSASRATAPTEQELRKWDFLWKCGNLCSKGHRSAIPPEEGALKTCFPEILSLSISVDWKWRDVEGKRWKGEKRREYTQMETWPTVVTDTVGKQLIWSQQQARPRLQGQYVWQKKNNLWDARAAPLRTDPCSCQLSTTAAFILACAHEDGSASEGREQEQNSNCPSKPLQARKRGNKCVTLYLEGTQACHLLNEAWQDQVRSIERTGLRREQAQDKAYGLAGLAPSILLPSTYKAAGALGDTATPSLAGPTQGSGTEQPLGTSPAWEGTRGRGSRGVRGLVPSPPEEKETGRDRQLRDRQETGTRSAQMQEPRSQLQTKVIRQVVLNSRVSKGFIGRAPSGK